MTDFDANCEIVIFSQPNISSRKRFEKQKEAYLRKRVVVLAQRSGLGKSIRTRYLLCLKTSYGHCPPALGWKFTG
jgi:hypothetical protein